MIDHSLQQFRRGVTISYESEDRITPKQALAAMLMEAAANTAAILVAREPVINPDRRRRSNGDGRRR